MTHPVKNRSGSCIGCLHIDTLLSFFQNSESESIWKTKIRNPRTNQDASYNKLNVQLSKSSPLYSEAYWLVQLDKVLWPSRNLVNVPTTWAFYKNNKILNLDTGQKKVLENRSKCNKLSFGLIWAGLYADPQLNSRLYHLPSRWWRSPINWRGSESPFEISCSSTVFAIKRVEFYSSWMLRNSGHPRS